MSNISRLLIFSAVFLMFLTALYVAIELSYTSKLAADGADSMIYGIDRNLTQQSKIESEPVVPGAYVLQSIFHISDLDADIDVDGIHFSKALNIDETDVSMIQVNRKYSVEHLRRADGSLHKVVFQIK
ncbi:hypothetical protein [Paenibacillus chitinolyticus]|uniref:hypothetical protein n=1 Tax=Paenibacillus chitinolyticus TaxID=79263 RepID=UPI001C4717AF|nr:hypothetical protein [Paenibacillus chitinolyticus]MBV6717214.1 hypothetical protein [Paenibacillus chitinolyticus]